MAYRALQSPVGRFPLGRTWRSVLDVGVAFAGAVSGLVALELPRIFVPISLVTTGYGLARIYGGLPRALSLDESVIQIEWWMGRKSVHPLATTKVQHLPDELVFLGPAGTHAIDRRDFREGDFEASVELLRERCPGYTERPIRR